MILSQPHTSAFSCLPQGFWVTTCICVMVITKESCLKCQKRSPYKVKGEFSIPVCARKQKNGPPSAAFLHPVATATMHCHPEGCTHPPPSVPFFPLAQNLPSKRIVPTDNMPPKSDDTKKGSSVVKGLNMFYVSVMKLFGFFLSIAYIAHPHHPYIENVPTL